MGQCGGEPYGAVGDQLLTLTGEVGDTMEPLELDEMEPDGRWAGVRCGAPGGGYSGIRQTRGARSVLLGVPNEDEREPALPLPLPLLSRVMMGLTRFGWHRR